MKIFHFLVTWFLLQLLKSAVAACSVKRYLTAQRLSWALPCDVQPRPLLRPSVPSPGGAAIGGSQLRPSQKVPSAEGNSPHRGTGQASGPGQLLPGWPKATGTTAVQPTPPNPAQCFAPPPTPNTGILSELSRKSFRVSRLISWGIHGPLKGAASYEKTTELRPLLRLRRRPPKSMT